MYKNLAIASKFTTEKLAIKLWISLELPPLKSCDTENLQMEKENSKDSENQMGGSKTPDENGEDHSEATNDGLEGKILKNYRRTSGIIKEIFILEFQRVSQEIDNLNHVLDNMESNVDNIKDQLVSILIELKEEREKTETKGAGDEKSKDKMDTS